MAKKRAQSAKSFVAASKTHKVKKNSSKKDKHHQSKEKILSAVKLQSQIEMKKKSDLKVTPDPLKLTRPSSICTTRIKKTSDVKSKSCDDFVSIFFILFNLPLKIITKKKNVDFYSVAGVPAEPIVSTEKPSINMKKTVRKSTRIKNTSDDKGK